MRITIEDDGKGMSEEFVAKVESPFTTTRTTRRVGMGIPLMKLGCEQAEGSFKIESQLGVGTKLTGSYRLANIDRPPLGDFCGTVHSLIVCNPEVDFYVEFAGDKQTLSLDTKDIREQTGDMPLNDPEISLWIKEYLEEAQQEAGITN